MTFSPDSPAQTTSSAITFRTVDLRGQRLSLAALRAAVPRAQHQTMADAEQKVTDIIHAVRSSGYAALSEYARTFDGVDQQHPRVPAAALRSALENLDPAVRAALEESISRARRFADGQRPQNIDVVLGDGATVSQNWVPVGRVGLYVPGGLAVYPSSVIMNVVPAQAAGVASIALASPPQKDFEGLPHPTILAAAALLGIDEVYAIGGAQAIAAFATGYPHPARTRHWTPWTWSPVPAIFSWPPPSGSSKASWASIRKPEPPRSPFWPTPVPTRASLPRT
ncbi:histidinol dehydrogenase [Arthrobacter sp. Hiyo6]|nr:histidinol dehydrogenase [Arthrobacter sp. Hiyo6]